MVFLLSVYRQIAANRGTKPFAMLWSVPKGALLPEKMTSLEIVDMYFFKFADFSQHLVLISLYLSQLNEIYIYIYIYVFLGLLK